MELTTQKIQKEIIRITSEYFKDDLDYFKLSKVSKEYKQILNELCEEEINNEEGRNDIKFKNGKALGTFWASQCIDDIVRTRQFIRGINKAIKEKLDHQKQLHILYAGTGPFAALILPLILRFSKQTISYTFLEINPLSFRILKNLLYRLGLEEYDITYINEDATKYKINLNNEPDIIISETMQNGLAKEQQVPIFLNLMSQLKGDSIFIPEKIELNIGLKEKGIPLIDLTRKHYHKEKKIFEVSKESMFPFYRSEKQINDEIIFEKKKTIIEKEKLEKYDQLLLITEIKVYENEKIVIKESSLTTPTIIQNIPDNLEGSIIIVTQYKISSEPKLEYKITLPKKA